MEISEVCGQPENMNCIKKNMFIEVFRQKTEIDELKLQFWIQISYVNREAFSVSEVLYRLPMKKVIDTMKDEND